MAEEKRGQRLIYIGNMLVVFSTGMVVSDLVPDPNIKYGLLAVGALLVFVGQFLGLGI